MVATTPNAVSPRLYKRHQRYDSAARHPNSQQQNKFLAAQATRLSSTSAVIFGKLTKYSAEQIAAAVNLAAIP